MFELQDLFQWERFITPSIIKIFYWLAVAIAVLLGLSGLFAGLKLIVMSPITGFVTVVASLVGTLAEPGGHARRHHLRPRRRGIRPDHVPHQRASRRNPQPGRAAALSLSSSWPGQARP